MKKTALTLIFTLLVSGVAFSAPRYISLAPSTTEILFALGLTDEIVGVSSFCDYPPAAGSKEKVGDFSNPSIEKIISLRPDYIFGTGLEQAPVIEALKRLKLNVYVADPSNFAELFETMQDIGKLTGRSREAAALVERMKRDIELVRDEVRLIPSEKRVRVFMEIWHEPLMTAGKGSFVDELITLAGGVNIAHETERPYCIFSAEKVISLNPQCIILAYMDRESPLKLVENRFGWNGIEAVRNKKVFNDIDSNVLLRPGPRITEGLQELYKRMYL